MSGTDSAAVGTLQPHVVALPGVTPVTARRICVPHSRASSVASPCTSAAASATCSLNRPSGPESPRSRSTQRPAAPRRPQPQPSSDVDGLAGVSPSTRAVIRIERSSELGTATGVDVGALVPARAAPSIGTRLKRSDSRDIRRDAREVRIDLHLFGAGAAVRSEDVLGEQALPVSAILRHRPTPTRRGRGAAPSAHRTGGTVWSLQERPVPQRRRPPTARDSRPRRRHDDAARSTGAAPLPPPTTAATRRCCLRWTRRQRGPRPLEHFGHGSRR